MHRRHHIMLAGALLVGALVLGALAAGDAQAQCAMCAQSAEAAGKDAPGGLRSLFFGALILLIPALLMMAGAGYLVWKYKDSDGQYSGTRSFGPRLGFRRS